MNKKDIHVGNFVKFSREALSNKFGRPDEIGQVLSKEGKGGQIYVAWKFKPGKEKINAHWLEKVPLSRAEPEK